MKLAQLSACLVLASSTLVSANAAKKSDAHDWEACPAGHIHVYVAYTFNFGAGYAVPCVLESQLDTEQTMKEFLQMAKKNSSGKDAVIYMIRPLRNANGAAKPL